MAFYAVLDSNVALTDLQSVSRSVACNIVTCNPTHVRKDQVDNSAAVGEKGNNSAMFLIDFIIYPQTQYVRHVLYLTHIKYKF